MADIIKGILGEVSGLVGTVVGAVVRGKATIRSRPRKSSKPPKQSQIDQRSKFAIITAFMSPNKELLNLGFPSYQNMSGVNAAVQYGLLHSITGTSPNFKLDLAKVAISKGSGNLQEATTLEMNPVSDGHNIVFTWDLTKEFAIPAQQAARGLDRGSFLLYNETKKKFIRYMDYVDRKAGTLSLPVPFIFAGDTIHVYFFFANAAGTDVTDTRYLGSIKTTG